MWTLTSDTCADRNWIDNISCAAKACLAVHSQSTFVEHVEYVESSIERRTLNVVNDTPTKGQGTSTAKYGRSADTHWDKDPG